MKHARADSLKKSGLTAVTGDVFDFVDTAPSPFEALAGLEDERGAEVQNAIRDARIATVGGLLEWLFANGHKDPRAVAQRAYVLAHKVRHDLLDYATCEEIAKLFGETRAMHSHRVKIFYDDFLKAHGARCVEAPWQKPAAAVIKSKHAAKGNQSRKIGKFNHGKR